MALSLCRVSGKSNSVFEKPMQVMPALRHPRSQVSRLERIFAAAVAACVPLTHRRFFDDITILVASQIVTLPSRHAVATQNVIPSILHRLECKLTALGLPTTHTR